MQNSRVTSKADTKNVLTESRIQLNVIFAEERCIQLHQPVVPETEEDPVIQSSNNEGASNHHLVSENQLGRDRLRKKRVAENPSLTPSSTIKRKEEADADLIADIDLAQEQRRKRDPRQNVRRTTQTPIPTKS